MRKVIQKSIVFILVVVALANLADYIYASALTSAATSSLSMFATITPSMTVVVDDTNPTLNITPSSGGTFDSASVNVSAYSNGSIGYTLTMTPSNTSLTGSSTGATIPTLQTGGYTSDTFPANYWGVSVDSGTYSPAAATNLITVSSSNPDIASNTHTVDLGVSLDLTAALDTYSTTLNFSATATTQTYPITFTFDSGITSLAIKDTNGVTQATIATSGNSANLDFAGTYTIVPVYANGYTTGTITLASGSGFVNSNTYTYTVGSNAGAVAVTSTPKIYMQNVSQATLAALMPNVGDEVTLYDNRDEKPYTVAHLADGNYWMTENLDHDIVAEANYYTPQNTDIPSAWTPSTATYATGTTTWNGSHTTPESYDPGNLCWDGVINYDWDGTLDTATTACGNDKHMHIGNYYNWTAAVAMNDSSSYTAQNTDVDQSICPAGWRLPIGGTTNTGSKSFQYLWNQYSSSFTDDTMMNSPLYFSYAGAWFGSSDIVGSYGFYWSSVVSNSYYAYDLNFATDDGVDPQYVGSRDLGGSVRCVARTKDYMQDQTQASLAALMPNVGDEVTLYDNRDEKPYTVAHLADGNYWMTQNLDHDIKTDGSVTYDSTTTDIPSAWTPSTATYTTGTTTWNGSFTAPESYDPGNLCWDGTINTNWNGTLSNETTACGNDKHIHIGNYYNWTAAIAMNDSSSYTTQNTDVNQSICPAGWRLPIGGTTNTGSKSFQYLWNQYSSSFNENTMMNSPLYFSYAGYWYGYSEVVGGYGYYWSSVVEDSGTAYGLLFGTDDGVYPQGTILRRYGISIRCVAR